MNILPLTVILPLIGFLILATFRDHLSEKLATIVGVGSMGISALVALLASSHFLTHYEQGEAVKQTLWTWMQIGDFTPGFTLYFDGLALTMTGVITGVGFFIHLFASWYMKGDKGFTRFFSYMNLFVASMLLLVLADNLLLLYLGWEGVGLCSYLLIGFYFKDRNNGKAAIKAFTVTRVGDVFLAFGLFLLFREVGTLNIHDIVLRVPHMFTAGNSTINLAALMLLGGAVGKSAQLPLQTWLADAMAGPTPVSALIHAATMVTAGVYLIARLHPVFLAAPDVLHFVGVVGAVTLTVAGFSALVQTDIKRILAYSTMSQLGYMFLALGVGAWQVAIFHLMTHAFFKALLFLSAGAVIVSVHHEQNVLKMGGLRKTIPFVWLCFLVGGGALAALPWVTVGFYSKDEILWEAWATGNRALYWAGVVGAFVTAIYTFRMIWLTFHGQAKTHAEKLSGWSYKLPLGVLLVLSTFVGAWIHPPLVGVLPEGYGALLVEQGEAHGKHTAEYIAMAAALSGVVVAAFLYVVNQGRIVTKVRNSTLGAGIAYWFYEGWGFDALYNLVFVKPFLLIGKLIKKDPIDMAWGILPALTTIGHKLSRSTQNGSLRGYAMSMGLGMVVLLILVMALQVSGH